MDILNILLDNVVRTSDGFESFYDGLKLNQSLKELQMNGKWWKFSF